jgi:putative FmdB family regulatory protein
MPMYDYKCLQCGIIREIRCSLNEKPALYHCGYNEMIKMPSIPAGVHFQGSGFYETDYKRKGVNQ